MRLAVRGILQLTQQFVDVRLIVVAIGVGIACSVHPRLSAERIDFQTGVVGKDVEAVALVHKARFEQCIALERVGRFGNVFVQSMSASETISNLSPTTAVISSSLWRCWSQ